MPNETAFDVIVVGGSYAGLSAALQVARTRRRVAVIDAGVRRNRFAAASHGFLGQDGRPPGDIVADARAQLLAYPTVTWLEGTADHAGQADGGFRVALASGEVHAAKRLVLATGVVDQLPDIPGLEAHWGRHVFLCPYCHGYELDNGRIGVIAVSPMALPPPGHAAARLGAGHALHQRRHGPGRGADRGPGGPRGHHRAGAGRRDRR